MSYLRIDQDDYYYEKSNHEERNEETIEHARDHMSQVIDILYGIEQFDSLKLENALDEICSALGVTIHENKLAIRSKDHTKKVWGFINKFKVDSQCN